MFSLFFNLLLAVKLININIIFKNYSHYSFDALIKMISKYTSTNRFNITYRKFGLGSPRYFIEGYTIRGRPSRVYWSDLKVTSGKCKFWFILFLDQKEYVYKMIKYQIVYTSFTCFFYCLLFLNRVDLIGSDFLF